MGIDSYIESIIPQVDEMVSRAIPVPCKCTWQTEMAKERRVKLKEAIIDIVRKSLTLPQMTSDEDTGARDNHY